MKEWTRELAKQLVIGRKRDGRGIYDPQAKLTAEEYEADQDVKVGQEQKVR